ncbi:hypothetical protein K438DRAFT_1935696 [Mycena galopus ATCC 62051]|nr:hypothetical protein K438DRAFT_1935696 [Mycena galopus ATCC 62051]
MMPSASADRICAGTLCTAIQHKCGNTYVRTWRRDMPTCAHRYRRPRFGLASTGIQFRAEFRVHAGIGNFWGRLAIGLYEHETEITFDTADTVNESVMPVTCEHAAGTTESFKLAGRQNLAYGLGEGEPKTVSRLSIKGSAFNYPKARPKIVLYIMDFSVQSREKALPASSFNFDVNDKPGASSHPVLMGRINSGNAGREERGENFKKEGDHQSFVFGRYMPGHIGTADCQVSRPVQKKKTLLLRTQTGQSWRDYAFELTTTTCPGRGGVSIKAGRANPAIQWPTDSSKGDDASRRELGTRLWPRHELNCSQLHAFAALAQLGWAHQFWGANRPPDTSVPDRNTCQPKTQHQGRSYVLWGQVITRVVHLARRGGCGKS